jgi:glutamate---cysteine ligase / carboxylate-amine ligase
VHRAIPVQPPPRTPGIPQLRAAFDAPSPLTVGIEEEVVLLDPATLDLLPRAPEVVARAAEPGIRTEMPAGQLELVTPPAGTVAEAVRWLAGARARAAAAAEGVGVLASVAVHPSARADGVLVDGDRYRTMREEYGWVARRQLVAALQVHVAVRPAATAVAVYTALRDHLPDLAALAAAAPHLEGEDTGLASIRPKLCELLPRQGVPPAFADLEEVAAAWAWGVRAGAMADVSQWWWEARLHPVHGTIEIRVCDAQASLAEVGAVAGVVHALCGWLAARAAAGDLPPATPTWRIEQNRWSACRHGVEGTMADLRTGRPEPTRDRLHRLLEDLRPTARALRCDAEVEEARRLLDDPAPARHRAVAAGSGVRGLCGWLVERFADPLALAAP